jgi:pimeloyl-ACP methyl ester carboxylesterase
MKKFRVLLVFLALILVLLLSSCFMMNRFIYTDAELEEHYINMALKPSYRTIEFEGHNVHYAVMSKSDTLPLLVMIHGAPGAWYGYMNLTDDTLLQRHFKMVAVDRLGYGHSGYGKAELSTEAQANAVESVIKKENTFGKKVYLMGRSYGAPIAAVLAMRCPDEVAKLLMVSPVIDPDKEKFYWFSNMGRWKVVQWFLPDMMNVATKEKFSHADEMRKLQKEWKGLKTPTYVLVGENDDIADTANYSFARKNITNCSALFMKLSNTGHLITYQHPDLIRSLLLESNTCDLPPYVAERSDNSGLESVKRN